MASRKRNHNHQLLKGRRAYTMAQIAEVFAVHPQTVRHWTEKGLCPIDPSSRPFLFLGQSVKDFLRNSKAKRRIKLASGEFYCPRCKIPRKPLEGSQENILTNRRLGSSGSLQVIIKAICAICQAQLRKFSSTFFIPPAQCKQREKGLNEHEASCLNTHLQKELNP